MTILLSLLLINGRDADKTAIYRIEKAERMQEKQIEGDMLDTKRPIAALSLGQIELTIHNFPLGEGPGIPLEAQVSRWIGQLADWEGEVTNISQGGFVGLLVIGSGYKGKERVGLIASAFKLARSSQRALRLEAAYHQSPIILQKLSDCTIKATGPLEAILKEKELILSLIHSFEMIDEIP